jgi:hypothetical protein
MPLPPAQTAVGALLAHSCEDHPPTVSNGAVVRRPLRRRRLLPNCSRFWPHTQPSPHPGGKAERGARARDPIRRGGRRPGRPLVADMSLRRGGRTRPRQATVSRSCTPRTGCAAGGLPTRRLRGNVPAPRPPVRFNRGPSPCPVWGCGLSRMGAARHDGGASCREAVEEGRPVARPPVQSSGAPPRGPHSRPPAVAPRLLGLLAGRPGLPACKFAEGVVPTHRCRARLRRGVGRPEVCPSRPPGPGLAAAGTSSATGRGLCWRIVYQILAQPRSVK